MMFWLLFFPLMALAQNEEIDLETVRVLERELPTTELIETQEDIEFRRQQLRYRPPYRKVTMEKILKSGTEYGFVKAGKSLVRLKDNKAMEIHESFYGKFFLHEDEQGFKYILSNDGSCQYKIKSSDFVSIQKETELYEPPLRYTPAPLNIVKSDFDKKLKVAPEFSFYVAKVRGSFMRDLFNDKNAEDGTSQQYGAHIATGWDLPIKVGGVIHYERASYGLTGGGNIYYSALSFGPQFKSKDFDVAGTPLRFQGQFRVSPFARGTGETVRGNVEFKFNSADVLFSVERPFKNDWGEFVLGAFYQQQWLNIKDQPEVVSINATNETNNSLGLSLSQVFQ
jgi:hypothetical protein